MLAVGALLPAVPREVLAVFRQASAQVAQGYTLRTLNPQQNALVVAMVDLIIPATDTPGAKAARVNEFMDVILTDWAEPDERQNFLNGLADVDKQSNELFGKNFVDTTTAQQTVLLASLDDIASQARARKTHRTRTNNFYADQNQQLKGQFFGVFRNMTLHGYYTSEIGFTQELKEEIVPGAQHGCVPVTDRKA